MITVKSHVLNQFLGILKNNKLKMLQEKWLDKKHVIKMISDFIMMILEGKKKKKKNKYALQSI